MKVLKEGKIVDSWIGMCDECGTVMEATKSELSNIDHDGDLIAGELECAFCDAEYETLFWKRDTQPAKRILRKAKLIDDAPPQHVEECNE